MHFRGFDHTLNPSKQTRRGFLARTWAGEWENEVNATGSEVYDRMTASKQPGRRHPASRRLLLRQ
jgi:hypothetical protein